MTTDFCFICNFAIWAIQIYINMTFLSSVKAWKQSIRNSFFISLTTYEVWVGKSFISLTQILSNITKEDFCLRLQVILLPLKKLYQCLKNSRKSCKTYNLLNWLWSTNSLTLTLYRAECLKLTVPKIVKKFHQI